MSGTTKSHKRNKRLRWLLTLLLSLALLSLVIDFIYSLSSFEMNSAVSTRDKFGLRQAGGQARQTKKNFHVLPKRLITVFGLESSGTKFLASTLAGALGAQKVPFFEDFARNNESNTEVQHISEPFGWPDRKIRSLPDIELVPPLECAGWPYHQNKEISAKASDPPSPYCFEETGFQHRFQMPQRFMVNITSHVQWYTSRGVDITAVILVRDDYAHFHGKLKYNRNPLLALKEDLHAKEIFIDAIQSLSTLPTNERQPYPELLMISYETLMALKEHWLVHLYHHLGINSTFVPKSGFKNGNKKYNTGAERWHVDPGEQVPASNDQTGSGPDPKDRARRPHQRDLPRIARRDIKPEDMLLEGGKTERLARLRSRVGSFHDEKRSDRWGLTTFSEAVETTGDDFNYRDGHGRNRR